MESLAIQYLIELHGDLLGEEKIWWQFKAYNSIIIVFD